MNLVVFSRPVFLYLLLLVPLMPLLYGIGRYLRVRRLRRFGDEEMVRRLRSSCSPWHSAFSPSASPGRRSVPN